MIFNHIMVWKFKSAPPQFQRLHTGPRSPEWIVLVPRDIHRDDIDTAIFSDASPNTVNRYQTDEGDVVYIGDARVQEIPILLAGARRNRPD
jgi:hypothetical protein